MQLFSVERALEEFYDSPTGVEPVPGLIRWQALNRADERNVIRSRVDHQFYGYAHLTQRAIHLVRLTRRIVGILLTLQQQQWRLSRSDSRQWALSPRIAHVLPRSTKEPPVIAGIGRFHAIFAKLIDDRRATDDRAESICLSFNEAAHFTAGAVSDKREARWVDRLRAQHEIHACHDV